MEKTLLNKNFRLNYLYKIVDKEAKTIRFSPNKAQVMIRKKKKELQEKYGRIRLLILKARQLGMTTFELIDGLDDCLFLKNQNIVITAHKQEKQQEMFAKVKYAYDSLPEYIEDPEFPGGKWYKPKPQYNNVNELYFPQNNSRIKVSLDSRSGTPSRLHITELAFRKDANDMMTGTLPSVPKDASITIETTANGVGGYFYDLWKQNKNMENPSFHTVFIPWYTDENYISETDRDIPDDLSYLTSIIRIDNGQKLTKKQINRYVEKYYELRKEVFQEYPSTDDEAFLATGDCVFNTAVLKDIKSKFYTEDLIYGEKLRIYEKTTDRALFGVDTSEGGANGDFSTIHVRNTDMRLLASYRGRIPPDSLCEVIDYLWKMYKQGVIGIERNNTGLVTIKKSEDYERYKYLYAEKTLDEITQRQTSKVGRHTNTKTRPVLIAEYEEAIRLGVISELDERTKSECFTFVYNENRKPEAQSGCHDDMVLGDAICYWMRKEPVRKKVPALPKVRTFIDPGSGRLKTMPVK